MLRIQNSVVWRFMSDEIFSETKSDAKKNGIFTRNVEHVI